MKGKGTGALLIILYVILFLAFMGAITLASIYFYQFNGEFGGQEVFGQFGDFIGGVLNPFLSFLTIILLLLSVWFQRQELSNVTVELGHMRSVHQQSLNMRHYEYIISTSKDENSDFQYALKRFVNVFSKECVIEFPSENGQVVLNKGSLFDILRHNGLFSTAKFDLRKSADSEEDIKDAFDELSSVVSALTEIIEKLKSLGCPKYMANQLLNECAELLDEYFYKQPKSFRGYLESLVAGFQSLRVLISTYPEYPELTIKEEFQS